VSTEPLPLAHDIARAVKDAGGRALIVGGWVRDRLLGRESKDIDIEVFGVEAGALKAILDRFGRVDTVGESFTVYKIAGLDVSLPRRESKTGRGHKGFTVIGDPSLSIVEAARRRDFTINAVSFDPLTGEYLDPYNGREDLAAKRLRVVDPATFGDDSLRVLRALQFAARFDLALDPDSARLCRSIPLDDLPAERIWGEIDKLLVAAGRPSAGWALALDLGVVDALFPELKALVGCRQEPEWHPEGDVWVHTLQVIDRARERIGDLERPQAVTVMLGALCHDLGKPATTAFIDGRIRSPFHEEAGVAPANTLLDTLNVNSIDGYDVRAQVIGIVANHLKPGAFHKVPNVSDGAFRRLALKVDLELLARVATSDCLGRVPGTFDCSAMDWFLERARALGVEHGAPKPFVLGRHVLAHGVTPGPHVGILLKQIYEMQLDGRITTVEEGLTELETLLRATP